MTEDEELENDRGQGRGGSKAVVREGRMIET